MTLEFRCLSVNNSDSFGTARASRVQQKEHLNRISRQICHCLPPTRRRVVLKFSGSINDACREKWRESEGADGSPRIINPLTTSLPSSGSSIRYCTLPEHCQHLHNPPDCHNYYHEIFTLLLLSLSSVATDFFSLCHRYCLCAHNNIQMSTSPRDFLENCHTIVVAKQV